MNKMDRTGEEALLSIPFPLKNLSIEVSTTSWETQGKCKTYSEGSFKRLDVLEVVVIEYVGIGAVWPKSRAELHRGMFP